MYKSYASTAGGGAMGVVLRKSPQGVEIKCAPVISCRYENGGDKSGSNQLISLLFSKKAA